MGLSAEVLLILAILGLYLYDASLLLYCNEAVFSPAGKRGWNVAFGSPNMGMRGRELFIPNLLLIHRPVFRLSWSFERTNSTGVAELQQVSFLPLAPALWGIATGLFVLLPLGFLTRLGDRALLSALILVFGNIVFALAWTWSHRSVLNLSTRRFLTLAFESIICPPFALNLVRHLSLQMDLKEDAVNAAQRLQSPESWKRTRDVFLARLDAEIELEEVNSERYTLMLERRNGLSGRDNACQE